MKNDYFNTLEERDLEITDSLEMNPVRQSINAVIETYFDEDKKFGINTKKYDNTWVALYADYNPVTKNLNIVYYIDTDNDSYERQYIPTDEEKQAFVNIIEQTCAEQNQMNCREFYVREYLEQAGEIQLICEKNGVDYQIRNVKDDFILYSDDGDGILKNHVGHEIELASYGDDECISIECMNCNEVLYSTDTEEIEIEKRQQEYGLIDKQESRMSELLCKAINYIAGYECANGLYHTLHNEIGMSNDEIESMGYSSLFEFFEDEQEDGMTMN